MDSHTEIEYLLGGALVLAIIVIVVLCKMLSFASKTLDDIVRGQNR